MNTHLLTKPLILTITGSESQFTLWPSITATVGLSVVLRQKLGLQPVIGSNEFLLLVSMPMTNKYLTFSSCDTLRNLDQSWRNIVTFVSLSQKYYQTIFTSIILSTLAAL